MNKNFKLQIPISSHVKNTVEIIAKEEGFESIQSFTRFLFTKIINREIYIPVISSIDETIDKKMEARLNKIYKKSLVDNAKGKLRSFENVSSMMEYLNHETKDSSNKRLRKALPKKNKK